MGKTDGRMAKEIDAESTEYIVLQHYGFETTETPNYLALWQAKGEDINARRNNISESVRLIIKGIDDKVKTVDLAQDQVDELMEKEVDEHGIDMEKKPLEDEVEDTIIEDQSMPQQQEIVEEEIIASREDEFLRIATELKDIHSKNDMGSNFYSALGLQKEAGDMGDMYRSLKQHKKDEKNKEGIDCPECRKTHPKRIPTRLLPGQKCKVCGYLRDK